MSGSEDTVVINSRQDVLKRETRVDGLRLLLRYGFLTLYVATATVSQLTLAVLLNYLITEAS